MNKNREISLVEKQGLTQEKVQQNPVLLDPKWVTGFVDGEVCFHIGINKNLECRIGVQILPEFTVVQHFRDRETLEKLKQFFGCGVVRLNRGDCMSLRVRKLQDLTATIIPFFDQHPLVTKKRHDFTLFKEVVSLVQNKEHLNERGVKKIREITTRMNRKASNAAKLALTLKD